MHNHDDEKGDSWMTWIMMFCCVLPFALILILGIGGKGLGVSTWVIFGGIIVMMAAHLFVMSRSHKHSDGKHGVGSEEDKNKNDKDSKTHSGHGCCH